MAEEQKSLHGLTTEQSLVWLKFLAQQTATFSDKMQKAVKRYAATDSLPAVEIKIRACGGARHSRSENFAIGRPSKTQPRRGGNGPERAGGVGGEAGLMPRDAGRGWERDVISEGGVGKGWGQNVCGGRGSGVWAARESQELGVRERGAVTWGEGRRRRDRTRGESRG